MTCLKGKEAKTKCVMHKMDTKLCIAVLMFKLRLACSDDFFKAESMGSGTLQIQQVWDLVCASLKLSFRLAHTRPH